MALLLNPEALLFANPASVASCIADSAQIAATGLPINALFWCMGNWGTTYPLSGAISGGNFIESNAALAARTLYLMARNGAVLDHGVNSCSAERTFIWKKRNYRLQEASPVRAQSCPAIGTPGTLWTSAKNPPVNGDSFAWILWRRTKCCVGW